MLKVPQHQVAGHEAGIGKLGPLVDESGRFYKPLQGDERGANEVAFYSSLSTNSGIPEHIQRFFPTFYGTQLVEASDGSGLLPHLVLEDLALGHVNPSIMDIKIGSRTWAPEASEKYIQKCLKKDRESSSLSLGFRISGLQIYRSKELGFWKPGKKAAQKLSTEEVKLVLRRFVSSNTLNDLDLRPDCASASTVYGGSTGILSQLLELKAWFEDQTIFHLYSCSILVIFEKELALKGKNPGAHIKLIDFAHVYEGRGVIDHNFLGGLCSLIKFISDILTAPSDCRIDISAKADQKNLTADNGAVADHKSHTASDNGVVADQKNLTVSDNGVVADQKNLTTSKNGVVADQKNLTASDNVVADHKNLTVSDNGVVADQKNLTVSDNGVLADQKNLTVSDNGVVADQKKLTD
ncbi:inositol polyphosphate multikinase alpha-like [Solanum stenotomum]|uniref:inositol polyphosphate multikinase alpha-like n=1 Tax=Solanum stenotomum TaxID=172797 RepID=UPI0020D0048B|nr:inositol polyphosphate multikinase alpha-like [Solanum stenotomum]XP_049398311.1 inositol polyphosphate multikinase alpha-like [Solanum stenotomum]XP_049398312.1 inositol polyphosphate multikinase alpha-like [Solanum stenotomum]XP_049398313.1 inositol polyphosphate multikinase alpha-like [Solanum stenotomum]